MRYFIIFLLCAAAFASDKRSVTLNVLDNQVQEIDNGAYAMPLLSGVVAVPLTFTRIYVKATIDGTPVTLFCDTRGNSKCITLKPGERQAEVKGDSIWVHGHNWDHSKKITVKFKIL